MIHNRDIVREKIITIIFTLKMLIGEPTKTVYTMRSLEQADQGVHTVNHTVNSLNTALKEEPLWCSG